MISKQVIDYLERLKRLYNIIRLEHTGTMEDIAAKIHSSRTTVYYYLCELKSLGADIRFDRIRNTYYFNNDFVLYATFSVKLESNKGWKKAEGPKYNTSSSSASFYLYFDYVTQSKYKFLSLFEKFYKSSPLALLYSLS